MINLISCDCSTRSAHWTAPSTLAVGELGSEAMPGVSSITSPRRARCISGANVPVLMILSVCAGGGIGQPLSLLLKMNKLVTELALYDIAGTPGVAADLSHCNTPVTVSAHTGDEELESCLKGADLVIIPAGIPRKPGMSRDDLFNTNAGKLPAGTLVFPRRTSRTITAWIYPHLASCASEIAPQQRLCASHHLKMMCSSQGVVIA